MNATSALLNKGRLPQPTFTPGQLVPAAARAARRVSEHVLCDGTALQRIYENRTDIRERINNMLPFETDAKEGFARHLKVVERQSDILEGAGELDMPILDPSFLSWKTRQGFPGFSIFTVENNATQISFLASQYQSHQYSNPGFNPFLMVPTLPPFMAEHYLDAELKRNLLGHCMAHNFSELTLTAFYRGLMPDLVRDKIELYRQPSMLRVSFEFIFIIAEAPDEKWQVKGIPQKDPLVVGVRKGIMWLIDAYDLTPTERFVKDLYSDPEAKQHS